MHTYLGFSLITLALASSAAGVSLAPTAAATTATASTTSTTRPKPTPLSGTGSGSGSDTLLPRAPEEDPLGIAGTTLFWPYAYVDEGESELFPVADVFRDMAGEGTVGTTTHTQLQQTTITAAPTRATAMPSASADAAARCTGLGRRFGVSAAVLGGVGAILLCVTVCGAAVRAGVCMGWGRRRRHGAKDTGAGGAVWDVEKIGGRVLDIRRGGKVDGTELSVDSDMASDSEGEGMWVSEPIPAARVSAVLLSPGEFFMLPSAGSGHGRTRSAPERRSEVFGHLRRVESEWDVVQAYGGSGSI